MYVGTLFVKLFDLIIYVCHHWYKHAKYADFTNFRGYGRGRLKHDGRFVRVNTNL